MPKKLFPKNFMWGASTASHQVEGGTENQWSVWELNHAHNLAKTAHKRLGWLENWDVVKDRATNPENYVSGRGIEHYRRYKEDFDWLEKIGLNAFRFGIEWSRLQPSKDTWDAAALAHYKEYIAELKKRNIEPVLNIWHWTMPLWFVELGGFEKGKNLKYWDAFVSRVMQELGHDLKFVITLNEPNVFASFGYLTGEWVPERKKPLQFMRVYWNLTRAHRRAYRIIKKRSPRVQVGIALQIANAQAKRPHNQLDQLTTRVMRYGWNWWFYNRIKRYQDYVGFNYYFTDYFQGVAKADPGVPINDLGWYMEPEGLYPLLTSVWRHYKKPIMITENGVADEHDKYRQWWLEETMIAMERALSEGVNVIGYFHWSLLDNFEWKYGWWPKFGLIAVDRENGMKRSPRPSAIWWPSGSRKTKIREIT